MIEYLNKRKFVNALAREAIAYAEDVSLQAPHPSGLRLEFETSRKDVNVLELLIRGNRVPQQWMKLEGGVVGGVKRYGAAHKMAFDIAFSASQAAAKKTGKSITIGLPEVVFRSSWNADKNQHLADAETQPHYESAMDNERP